MKRFAVTVVLLVLAGCKTTSTGAAPPSPAVTTPRPAVTTPAGYKSVCAGFRTFFYDLTSQPPSQDWQRLLDDADRLVAAPGAHHELAVRLQAYVSAQSFPHEGNAEGRPVQDLVDVCF